MQGYFKDTIELLMEINSLLDVPTFVALYRVYQCV